jgi:hypothetical protein
MWRNGRRNGLKILKSPILFGHFPLNADHVFHRENESFAENCGEYRGAAIRGPKVEQK